MAQAVAAAAGGGVVAALGSVLSTISSFVKDVIVTIIEGVRKIMQWYMDVLRKDPIMGVALALVAIYWLLPER
ncbi:MAG: hypothetical protein QXG57_06065 [Thermofilaceae archaeon]